MGKWDWQGGKFISGRNAWRDVCEVSIGDGFGGLLVHFQGIFRGKLAAGSGTWYNKGNFKNQ